MIAPLIPVVAGWLGSKAIDAASKPSGGGDQPYKGEALDASKIRYQGRDEDYFQGKAAEAERRGAFEADFAQANADRQLGLQSRGAQQDALGLYRQMALGQGPSAAQAQFQSNLGQSIRAQQALANSARGGSQAIATANLRGAQTAGDMALQGAQQAAALRAQEQQQAMAGYAGLGTGIRGQDAQMQGMSAAQAQFQAQQQLANRGMNDQRALGLSTLGQNAAGATTQGVRDAETIQKGYGMQAAQMQAQKAIADREMAGKIVTGGLQAISSGAAALSDERVKDNTRDGSHDIQAVLDSLNPKSFHYKPEVGEGTQPRLGILAQDLDDTSLGQSAIRETSLGKAVDVKDGMSLSLAGLANLNERIKALESRKAA